MEIHFVPSHELKAQIQPGRKPLHIPPSIPRKGKTHAAVYHLIQKDFAGGFYLFTIPLHSDRFLPYPGGGPPGITLGEHALFSQAKKEKPWLRKL
jgi:hypothetical protein